MYESMEVIVYVTECSEVNTGKAWIGVFHISHQQNLSAPSGVCPNLGVSPSEFGQMCVSQHKYENVNVHEVHN